MKRIRHVVCGLLLLWQTAFAGTFAVPGTSNPWLAGMPDGSTARRGDTAPAESPVLVTNIQVQPGSKFLFFAYGSVSRGVPLPYYGPDGETNTISHYLGAENGIADLTAPFESLVGVFLGPNQPDFNVAPTPLDFSAPASRDYSFLSPKLRQPFLIGNGLNKSGAFHQVIAPAGATRLFLGIVDEYSWYNNEGSFTVQVAQVPTVSIAATKLDRMILSWPESSAAFAVQENPNASSTGWTTVTNAPVLTNGEYQVSIQTSHTRMFYRLMFQTF